MADINYGTASVELLENQRRSLAMVKDDAPALTAGQAAQLLGRVLADENELHRLRAAPE